MDLQLEPPEPSELDVISMLLSASPVSTDVTVGPGDDAAVLPDGTAITVDTLVEGIHWDNRLSPADVGWKAVAVSASDLAAMGACPQWMVLALSIPRPAERHWISAFASGIGDAARTFGVTLVGGDTTRSPSAHSVTVTMGGPCAGEPIRRDGGQPGDDLWVTGVLGLAGAGWALSEPPQGALSALRRPHPPIQVGAALAREGLVTAMMDLSDGLAVDLPRLCAASGTGAQVDQNALPTDPLIATRPDRLALQTATGEDYELMFSASPTHRKRVQACVESLNHRCTRIGSLTDDNLVSLRGQPWPIPRFTHFRPHPRAA